MSESHKLDKLVFTGNNYFCNASTRPECIRFMSKKFPDSNICCLYCEGDTVERCIEHNKRIGKKVKPCSVYDIGLDEYCEFSV